MEEDSLNNDQSLSSELEDEILSDLESDDEDYSTLYSCNICEASGMSMNEFLKHASKHSTEERQHVLERLASDKELEEVIAKSTAASYGFIKQLDVISSVNLYFCTVCNQGNLLLKNLQEHSRLHPQSYESHFCNLCQQHFEDNGKLAKHLDTHLDNNDLFCQYCNKKFTVIEELEVHESLHFKAEYICVECRASFISKYYIMEHFKESHSRDNSCLICQKKFKSVNRRDRHFMIHSVIGFVTRNMKNFSCVYCEKRYDNKVSLQRHVLFLHNDRLPYICHHCGYTAYHEEPLKEHVNKEHYRSSRCTWCNATFGKKSDLDDHMSEHVNLTKLFCKFCGSRFRSEKNLKTHILSHKDVNTLPNDELLSEKKDSSKDFPLVCKVCSEHFSVEESYNIHLEDHLYKIKCDLCGKAFENDTILNIHLNKIHTGYFWKPDLKKGVHPFQCELCSASFRLEFDLEEHNKIHTAMYQCHICFREFITDRELVDHITNHKEGTNVKIDS